MSAVYGKVISLILQERFGDVVDDVAKCLFKQGPSSLLQVKKATNYPLSKVKESLCVLMKHNLVSCEEKQVIIYTLLSNKVMLMLRYPLYLKLIKRKFGDAAEILTEEVLQRGHIFEEDLLSTTLARLKKNIETAVTTSFLKEKLNSLVIAKYLVKCQHWHKKFENNAVDKDRDESAQKNEKTFWFINFDRFHQDLRDELIVAAFTNKFDNNAGELVRVLVQQMYIRTEPWAETSNPIPILEVKDLIRKMNVFPQLIAFFEQYVSILEHDNSNFVHKVGEASGGSFQLNMKKIFNTFTWEICEQIVLEKFDTKAARIFRLVKEKSFIEPEQIPKLAMIPSKEARMLSYNLLDENILQTQELKKSNSSSNSGPAKCFVLFYIDLNNLIRTVLEMCYKTLFNLMTRRNHFKHLNKGIIHKKQRIDTILLSMRTQGASEDQLQDIEEMLTPPEREIFKKYENSINKINALELEIDQTIFFLELYLMYH